MRKFFNLMLAFAAIFLIGKNCLAQNAEITGYGAAKLGMTEQELLHAVPSAKNCSSLSPNDHPLHKEFCDSMRAGDIGYVAPLTYVQGTPYLPSYTFGNGVLTRIFLKYHTTGEPKMALDLLMSTSQLIAEKYGNFDHPPETWRIGETSGYKVVLTRGGRQITVSSMVQTYSSFSTVELWIYYSLLTNPAGTSSSF